MHSAIPEVRPTRNAGRRQTGFSIVELMIVIAIIGLLAGIAVPSYRDQVNKGKRTEGKAALTGAAARMERYYTQNNCYPSAACGNPTSADSATALTNAGIPGFSGDNAAKAAYNISLSVTPQAFTITAAPRAPFTDPLCGNLTLANTGRKWTQSNGVADDAMRAEGCW